MRRISIEENAATSLHVSRHGAASSNGPQSDVQERSTRRAAEQQFTVNGRPSASIPSDFRALWRASSDSLTFCDEASRNH